MEYVEGSDLETLVRRQGPLPVGLACEMMRQAARALQHAHERGMVHRDVKPANLLVPRAPGTPPVAVKVADFGLARLRRTPGPNSLPSQSEKRFVGTPDYVSPEQVRDASAVDGRSDLYSLGCTFYYALAGRKPFRGQTVFETVFKHLEEEAPPLRAIRPEIPPAVLAIVRRLMAKDPARRFQTPADLVGELDFLCGAVAGLPLPVPEPAHRAETCLPEAPPERGPAPTTRFIPALAIDRKEAPRAPEPIPAGPGAGNRPVAEPTVTCAGPQAAVLPVPEDRRGAAGDPLPVPDPGKALDRPPPPAGDQRVHPTAAPPGNRALRARWRQWTRVVELFAGGADACRVNERAYRALHRELLEACRSRPEAFGQMAEVVEPWLEPQAFASADREALGSLLVRCREVEREVFGPGRPWGLADWAAVFAAALFAGLVGLALLGGRGGAAQAKLSLSSVWYTLTSHPFLSLGIGLPALVLASVSLFSRRARN